MNKIYIGYVGTGEIESDDISGGGFDEYAWGQTDTLNVSFLPEIREFVISSLTVGEYYELSFSYQLRCDYVESSYQYVLYEVIEDYVYDNVTDSDVLTIFYRNRWSINGEDLSGDESGDVTYTFMADASEHTFIFADNITTDSGCFIDIPYTFLLKTCLSEVLTSDMYCSEIEYDPDTVCAPFIFVYSETALDYDDAEAYCQGTYDESLFCPQVDDGVASEKLEALLQFQRVIYGVDDFYMGIQRVGTEVSCYPDTSLVYSAYLTQNGGYSSVDADCFLYEFDSDTDYGLEDQSCTKTTNALVCAQNWTANIDPVKFGGASTRDIAVIQECVLEEIDPYIQITDLEIKSRFSAALEEFEETNDGSNKTFCVESLTAMMEVDAEFVNEFGCEIEYNADLGKELPMYELEFAVYFTDYDFTTNTNDYMSNNISNNRNSFSSTTTSEDSDDYDYDYDYIPWQLRFNMTKYVIAERIDDIISKSDSLSQAGIDIVHNIVGINNDILDDSMIVRFKFDQENSDTFENTC